MRHDRQLVFAESRANICWQTTCRHLQACRLHTAMLGIKAERRQERYPGAYGPAAFVHQKHQSVSNSSCTLRLSDDVRASVGLRKEFRGGKVNSSANDLVTVANRLPVQQVSRFRAIVSGLLGPRFPVAIAWFPLVGVPDDLLDDPFHEVRCVESPGRGRELLERDAGMFLQGLQVVEGGEVGSPRPG